MPSYIGALTLILLIAMVLARVQTLQTRGVAAMKFGQTDKTDYLIPPFVLFYFYLVLALTFRWPTPIHGELFSSTWAPWLGVLCCIAAVALIIASLVSFGASFRVGIDQSRPGKLVTSGVFRFTRNPMYVAFGFVLLGEFLIHPNWILFAYLIAGLSLFHRQVLREENSLHYQYGDEYERYCHHVRRYL